MYLFFDILVFLLISTFVIFAPLVFFRMILSLRAVRATSWKPRRRLYEPEAIFNLIEMQK
jgi:hypothetical protein